MRVDIEVTCSTCGQKTYTNIAGAELVHVEGKRHRIASGPDRSAAEALSADAAWEALREEVLTLATYGWTASPVAGAIARHRPIIEVALDRERAAALPTLADELEAMAEALLAGGHLHLGDDLRDAAGKARLAEPRAAALPTLKAMPYDADDDPWHAGFKHGWNSLLDKTTFGAAALPTQCTGYAGDPGASAPRCESYLGHPGRHFIRPVAAIAQEGSPVGLEVERVAAALHETAGTNHNLGEGPFRAICSSIESHTARAEWFLAALSDDVSPGPEDAT